MRYGSVCSGIEAASIAWNEPLGWKPAFFSEVDPFCCALLEWHWPKTPNLGDIANVEGCHGPVDLLVGGTPCQDFSVNGRRAGMAGFRGSITGEYLRVVDALRPTWLVWENVAGVLDADKGIAFGSFLGTLADCGYAACWRVLDLVGFGIPQQRRRLFLVGRLGPRSVYPAAVLFDPAAGGQYARPLRAVRGQSSSPAGDHAGPFGWTGDPTPKCCPGYALTLRAQQGGEGVGVGWPGVARRFTLAEWERLNGFPVGHTAVLVDGEPASDSRRRHALGNTFPVPILAWIGRRIDYLEKRCG